MKRFFSAIALTGLLGVQPMTASAQDSTDFVSQLEAATLACAIPDNSVECETLLQTLWAQIEAAGLSDEDLANATALYVDAVVRIARNNPDLSTIAGAAIQRVADSPVVDEATKTALTSVATNVTNRVANVIVPPIVVKPASNR